MRECGKCSEKPKERKTGSRTAKTATRFKRVERQARLDQVEMLEVKLKNVYNFVYLGTPSKQMEMQSIAWRCAWL